MALENPHIEVSGEAMVAISIGSAKQLGAVASCLLMGIPNREQRRELRHTIGETLLKAHKLGDEITPPLVVQMPLERFEVFGTHVSEELDRAKRLPSSIGSLLRGFESAIETVKNEAIALVEK